MASDAARRVVRQRSALVAAGLGLIACLVLLVFAVMEASVPWMLLLLGIGALIVSIMGLPCVVLTGDGVEIRNIVRAVRFTWPAIDVVESRWNLKIFTPQDKGYGAWAISSQRARAQGVDHPLAGAGLGPRPRRGQLDSTPMVVERPGSAGDVASQILAAKSEYDMLVARGRLPARQARVDVVPNLPGLALVVGGLVAAVVGFILI